MQVVGWALGEGSVSEGVIYLYLVLQITWLRASGVRIQLNLMRTDNRWNDTARQIFSGEASLDEPGAVVNDYHLSLVELGLHLFQAFFYGCHCVFEFLSSLIKFII